MIPTKITTAQEFIQTEQVISEIKAHYSLIARWQMFEHLDAKRREYKDAPVPMPSGVNAEGLARMEGERAGFLSGLQEACNILHETLEGPKPETYQDWSQKQAKP